MNDDVSMSCGAARLRVLCRCLRSRLPPAGLHMVVCYTRLVHGWVIYGSRAWHGCCGWITVTLHTACCTVTHLPSGSGYIPGFTADILPRLAVRWVPRYNTGSALFFLDTYRLHSLLPFTVRITHTHTRWLAHAALPTYTPVVHTRWFFVATHTLRYTAALVAARFTHGLYALPCPHHGCPYGLLPFGSPPRHAVAVRCATHAVAVPVCVYGYAVTHTLHCLHSSTHGWDCFQLDLLQRIAVVAFLWILLPDPVTFGLVVYTRWLPLGCVYGCVTRLPLHFVHSSLGLHAFLYLCAVAQRHTARLPRTLLHTPHTRTHPTYTHHHTHHTHGCRFTLPHLCFTFTLPHTHTPLLPTTACHTPLVHTHHRYTTRVTTSATTVRLFVHLVGLHTHTHAVLFGSWLYGLFTHAHARTTPTRCHTARYATTRLDCLPPPHTGARTARCLTALPAHYHTRLGTLYACRAMRVLPHARTTHAHSRYATTAHTACPAHYAPPHACRALATCHTHHACHIPGCWLFGLRFGSRRTLRIALLTCTHTFGSCMVHVVVWPPHTHGCTWIHCGCFTHTHTTTPHTATHYPAMGSCGSHSSYTCTHRTPAAHTTWIAVWFTPFVACTPRLCCWFTFATPHRLLVGLRAYHTHTRFARALLHTDTHTHFAAIQHHTVHTITAFCFLHTPGSGYTARRLPGFLLVAGHGFCMTLRFLPAYLVAYLRA